MTVDCVKCDREVFEEALDENKGCCPYCEKFLTPPQTVLEQYEAIRQSGVTNMLEWDTVIEVAVRHDFYTLVGFLQDESRMPTDQIEAISRGLDGDVDPAVDPEEIREEQEKVEEKVRSIRTGGV